MAGTEFKRQHLLTTQRGAVAVWMAGALMALIAATLLAIDTGRLYYEQRNLQRLASLAAVSAAQTSSGCAADGIPAKLSEVVPVVNALLLANGGTADMLTSINGSGTVELGKIDGSTGIKTLKLLPEGDSQIDAVRVNLSKQRPPSFLLRFMGSDSGGLLYASATAQQAVRGNLSVGSGLLNLNAGLLNVILSGLLGGNVNLSLVDYQSLASTNVSVGALATSVGLTVKDLSDPLALGAQAPLVRDLLNNLSTAITDSDLGVPPLLRSLAQAAQGNSTAVLLSDILGPVVTDVAAAVPAINLLDLVTALGAAAAPIQNGEVKPIKLPVGISLGSLTNVNVFVQVLEPAQVSPLQPAGVATATTAQIRVKVRLQLDPTASIEPALDALFRVVGLGGILANIDLNVAPANIGIDLDVAKATARIDSLYCPSIESPDPAAELSASPSLVSLRMGTFNGAAADAPNLLNSSARLVSAHLKVNALLGIIPLLDTQLYAGLTAPATLQVGNDAYQELPNRVTRFDRKTAANKLYWQGTSPVAGQNPQTVGSSGLLGSALSSLTQRFIGNITLVDPNNPSGTFSILGISLPAARLLNGLVTGLNEVVLGPLLSGLGTLLDTLVDPLLKMLGIQAGTATVSMGVVDVGRPVSVTTCIPGASGARGCPVVAR